MNRPFAVLAVAVFLALGASTPSAIEGIAGEVVKVDQQKRCLWLDWNNNTQKIACWTDKTAFSVLETGKAAKPTDVRKGTYVRMEGADKDGTYWATEIVIWEAASKPAAQ